MSEARDATARGGAWGRIHARAVRVFSPRTFLLALAATGGGLLLVGSLLPLGTLGGVAGVLAGAFLFGLLRRGYVETTVAGGVAAGVGTLLDVLVVSVLGGVGVPVAVLGVGAGAAAGLIGHYFGRDLRAGLTRDL